MRRAASVRAVLLAAAGLFALAVVIAGQRGRGHLGAVILEAVGGASSKFVGQGGGGEGPDIQPSLATDYPDTEVLNNSISD